MMRVRSFLKNPNNKRPVRRGNLARIRKVVTFVTYAHCDEAQEYAHGPANQRESE